MDSVFPIAPLPLDGVKTRSIAGRTSKVTESAFAHVPRSGSFADFWDSLPEILAGERLRAAARAIVQARRRGRNVLWGIGGHVIKCGVAPLLLRLLQDGFVQGIACNGAVAVHDYEVALSGATSEDVDAALPDGSFGVTEETGRFLNAAARTAAARQIGLGEAIGLAVGAERPSGSLFAACVERRVPITVHVSLGCDVWHLHPTIDPAAVGAATHHDFRLFCALVRGLDGGGVYVNIGSAVVLPEVFLKAITVVRNLGHRLDELTTIDLDFAAQYRPMTNVVKRPTAHSGRGIHLTGHHEILVPLLAAGIAVEAARP